jgi:KUP system potassium uptake protein
MATIRIAETVHPLHHTRSATEAATTGREDGIYNIRAISRERSRSRDRWSLRNGPGDSNDPEDDDPGLRQTGDFKHKQV